MKLENNTIKKQYENLIDSLRNAYDKIPLSEMDSEEYKKKFTNQSSLAT